MWWLLPAPAEAQLLKKIGKKAEAAAERTILNRTDKEVSRGTDKAIDGVMEGGKKEPQKKEPKEKGTTVKNKQPFSLTSGMDDVPNAYTFSYRATMKIISAKNEFDMVYWLEPKATYFASKISDDKSDNITVMDLENEAMVMFMNTGNEKMAMRIKANRDIIEKYAEKAAAEDNTNDPRLTPIEGKTILGYACKGFQIETDEGISKVWVTDQAPVGSIGGVLYADRVPSGALDFGSETLFMEMEHIPRKRKKDQLRMICTDLSAEKLTIRKADYKTMALGGK